MATEKMISKLKNHSVYKKVQITVCVLLSFLCILLTAGNTISLLWAAFLATPLPIPENLDNEVEMLNLRRKIQRHFSDAGVFIPMEDIRIRSQVVKQESYADTNAQIKIEEAQKMLCGENAHIMVWLPLMVRIPYFGKKIYYWCWTPRTFVNVGP